MIRRALPFIGTGLFLILALAVLFAVMAPAQSSATLCVEGLSLDVDHDQAIVHLSWLDLPGATGYFVSRVADGGPPQVIAMLGPMQISYTDSPAPDGVLEYRVAADGPPSDECPPVEVHIGGEDPTPTEPVCVDNLKASVDASGITLMWDPVQGATSYDVQRAVGAGALTPYVLLPPDATQFKDTAVTPGVSYRYTVSANGLPSASDPCREVMAAAIPFLPGIFPAALAALGVVGAYVAMRRKR